MFTQLLESYFEETSPPENRESRHFRIAGNPATIHFGGDWSREMAAAISHLEVSDRADHAFEIHVWDGQIEPRNHLLRAYLFVLTNWWFSYTGPRGELLDIHSDRISATYHPGTETMSVVDLERNKAFYWKRYASPALYYEACSPFRSLLHVWMRSLDRYFVHGAAVGHANGGVLLVGKGGSGKSTTALSCLQSGMHYAGDDYCALQESAEDRYDVQSLYCTAKVVAMRDLESFPEMSDKILNPSREPGEKVAISLSDYKNTRLIHGFPLRAILVPVITGRMETEIQPCSPQEALLAIAPSTLAQLPASGKRDMQFLGSVARRVPCYRISLGTSLREIPEKISALLQTLSKEQTIGLKLGASNLP